MWNSYLEKSEDTIVKYTNPNPEKEVNANAINHPTLLTALKDSTK